MKKNAEFRSVRATNHQNDGDVTELTVTVERVVDIEKQMFAYLVTCSQDLRISGLKKAQKDLPAQSIFFVDYPAGIENHIFITPTSAQVSSEIAYYTPKTINCVVQALKGSNMNQGGTDQWQYTSGWSKADTNSFGISLGVGMQGPIPTAELGSSFNRSTTSEQNASETSMHSTNYSMDASSSSTISIKDWGSYASVDQPKKGIVWNWVQENPWSFLRYRLLLTDSESQLDLQPSDKMALYDGYIVTPPSELSTFGVDFTSKVQWLLRSNVNEEQFDTQIQIETDTTVYRATHGVVKKVLKGKMAKTSLEPFPFPISSLAKLALEPLGTHEALSAAVNFRSARRFVGPLNAMKDPTRDWAGSKSMVSDANNVMVIQSKEFGGGVEVTLDQTKTAAVRVYFKVDQTVDDATLALKCWVQKLLSVVAVKFTIYPESNNGLLTTFTRHIDWDEGGGAVKSLLTVELRNRDYLSDDCCDFLGNGVNVVDMEFSSPSGKPVTLTLQALAMA